MIPFPASSHPCYPSEEGQKRMRSLTARSGSTAFGKEVVSSARRMVPWKVQEPYPIYLTVGGKTRENTAGTSVPISFSSLSNITPPSTYPPERVHTTE
ncbi:hypothetical protein Y032_0048g1611 [Ancylostoma ceylanicum]|uniref:Uncharacterized protein n=1 Tax=Ancylostoma ceylanicum TaxID=53326 RepID=A0A016U9X6_9BILA|nr:hypothetical protein Y032_0048g1611 [Ancylostoma ceylanicum]